MLKAAMNKMESRLYNRLILEKSPYLLQHASNPVDWYPWGEEAFEIARRENKPIFLSIGYSTCHWCHVMEKESFKDEKVAYLMNEAFINIKVDREERPDIDSTYMALCQMITGSGGWPLSIVMTPEKKPFFAGTYIPKTSRYGYTGMMDLIPRISDLWISRRDDIEKSASEIVSYLKETKEEIHGTLNEKMLHDKGFKQLSGMFDEKNGGFGTAPKFPTSHSLTFLLRCWKSSGNERALAIVEKTLEKMRFGGIYDHIGYGFHRYSTDAHWFLPHFEKMLYDQALLAIAYTEAFQAAGKEIYRQTAEEILTYVLREMTSPEGGFYSAEDADSEGEEGKFYLWSAEEVRQILTKEEVRLAFYLFNIEEKGNCRDKAAGKEIGKNILYLKRHLYEIAAELNTAPDKLKKRVDAIRNKLFKTRKKRIHPHKDDKILSDLNGIMIAALAKGGKVFGAPYCIEAAKKAVNFIFSKMTDAKSGRLFHSYRDGEAKVGAFSDDYAFMIWGLIELYQATFETHYLKKAFKLTDILINDFRDAEKGGFYFTSKDGETVLIRKKEIYDGALPSGNSVSIQNLFLLARMTGNTFLEETALNTAKAFAKTVEKSPAAYTHFLSALSFAFLPSCQVVVAGGEDEVETKNILKILAEKFIPGMVVLYLPYGEKEAEITEIAPFAKGMSCLNGKATVYICRNFKCSLPITDMNEMLKLLDEA